MGITQRCSPGSALAFSSWLHRSIIIAPPSSRRPNKEWARWERPATWGKFGDVQMNVTGTDGVLNLNFTPMNLYACDQEGWKLPDTCHWPEVNGKLAGAIKLEVEHFFECVLRDEEPLVTGEDGRRSLEIALAAERSIAEDRPVSLPA